MRYEVYADKPTKSAEMDSTKTPPDMSWVSMEAVSEEVPAWLRKLFYSILPIVGLVAAFCLTLTETYVLSAMILAFVLIVSAAFGYSARRRIDEN